MARKLKPAGIDILKVPAEVDLDFSDADKELSNFIGNAETRLKKLFTKKKNNPLNISTREMEDGIKTVAALYDSVIKDINRGTESAATKIRKELVDRAFSEFSGLKISAFGSEVEGLQTIVERYSTSLSKLSLEQFSFGDSAVGMSKQLSAEAKQMSDATKKLMEAEDDYQRHKERRKKIKQITRHAKEDKISDGNLTSLETRRKKLRENQSYLSELVKSGNEDIREECETAIGLVEKALSTVEDRIANAKKIVSPTKKTKSKQQDPYDMQAFLKEMTPFEGEINASEKALNEFASVSFQVGQKSLTAAEGIEKMRDVLADVRKESGNVSGMEQQVDVIDKQTNAIEKNTSVVQENAKAWEFSQTESGQISMFKGMSDPIEEAVDAMHDFSDATKEVAQIDGQISFNDLAKQNISAAKQETSAIEARTVAIEENAQAKKKYYDIDENAAKSAKQAMSFDDYIDGSATEAYKQSIDEMERIVEEKKKQFPEQAAELDKLLDRYAKRLAEFINKKNRIDASVPSMMIAGPDGVSAKQKEGQNKRSDANFKFYQDKIEPLADKIKNYGSGAGAIRTDSENAIDALEKRVEDLKKVHQIMLDANKYFKKHKTLDGFEGLSADLKKQVDETRAAWGKPDMQPFPPYALQNSRSEIKRLETRIKEISGLRADDGLQEDNDFYSLMTDKEDMRIRISFKMGKPDQEIIDMLKGKSFKWSPKNNAWQRQLTDNAVSATKKLQETLREHYGVQPGISNDVPDKLAEPWKFFETPSKQISMFEGMADPIEEATDAMHGLGDAAREVAKIEGQISFDDLAIQIKDTGAAEQASQQLATEQQINEMDSIPKLVDGMKAIEASAEYATAAQEELTKANNQVTTSADNAEQQIREQADAAADISDSQPQTADKGFKLYNLTSAEHQAVFGGGALERLLDSYNIAGDDRAGIIKQFEDAIRLDKTSYVAPDEDDRNAAEGMLTDALNNVTTAILNSASITTGLDDQLKEFSNYMAGKKIRYGDTQKAEFGDDWSDVRKSNTRILTPKSTGIPIDTIYQELIELFPGLFDANVVNENDQLRRILEVNSEARAAKKNNFKNVSALSPDDRDGVHESVVDLYVDGHNALIEMMSAQATVLENEERIADAVEQGNQARREGVQLNDSSEIDATELIERDLSRAIATARSALDNETTLFSLKGVFNGDELVQEARNFVDNIAEQANLKVGSFGVKNDLIHVQLYNDELKVTVDQTYRLQQASEDAEASLELIGQSFKQNVKALNADNFDVEGVRARATASVEKVRSSLHGLNYDLTDLEKAAKNIGSQEDFAKFNNLLKAAQDNIQAIRNSTVSKNSMNPFANMQRDMQNANIELDTMQLKLRGLGEVDGIQEAEQTIKDMRAAVDKFNQSTDAESQQGAYNEYSNLRSKFKAQLEYLNVSKRVGPIGPDGPNGPNNIKKYYMDILDVVAQINGLDSKINDLTFKDKGTGLYAGVIQNLETQKSYLLNDINSLQDDLAKALSIDPSQGKDALSLMFEDARVQAALTVEEVQNIQKAFMQTENIRFNFGAKISEQIQPVVEKVSHLMQMIRSGEITDSGIVGSVSGISATIGQKTQEFQNNGSPLAALDLMKYTNGISEHISELYKAVIKEQKYFANKKQYANISAMEDYSSTVGDMENVSSSTNKAKQSLESFVNTFSDGKAVITGFTTSADGISKINFSVLDEATHQFRTFSSEMGMFTSDVYTFETSMKNMSAGSDAAQKSLGTLSQVIAKLSGIEGTEAQVQNLWKMMQDLQANIAKLGSSGDVGGQNMLKNMAADADKAAKSASKMADAWKQVEGSIDGENVINLGKINDIGDAYSEMCSKIKASVGDATMSNVKFDDSTNKLTYTLTESSGAVKQMSAHIDQLTGNVITQVASTGRLKTAWEDIGSSLAGIKNDAFRYIENMLDVGSMVQMLKTGFNEVKEIDTALTELRKVTDETSATYSNFLQTMSKSGAVVGSTVKDLTTSAAD